MFDIVERFHSFTRVPSELWVPSHRIYFHHCYVCRSTHRGTHNSDGPPVKYRKYSTLSSNFTPPKKFWLNYYPLNQTRDWYLFQFQKIKGWFFIYFYLQNHGYSPCAVEGVFRPFIILAPADVKERKYVFIRETTSTQHGELSGGEIGVRDLHWWKRGWGILILMTIAKWNSILYCLEPRMGMNLSNRFARWIDYYMISWLG